MTALQTSKAATATAMAEPLSLELRALALKAVIGEAEKQLKAWAPQLDIAYPLPTTVPVESPLDHAPLGYVQRARTTRDWVMVSVPQFEDYLAAEFPAALEPFYLLEVPGIGEPVALPELHPITQALLQAAPGLLEKVMRSSQETREAAVQQSRDDGVASAPGIQQVMRSKGALSLVYDKKEAPAALRRLVNAGRFDLAQLLAIGAGDDGLRRVAS